MTKKTEHETDFELPEIALFSIKEVAIATSFSERYWRGKIQRREIPVIHFGRSIRIKRIDLLLFLKNEQKKGGK